jgi:hypothetical protein
MFHPANHIAFHLLIPGLIAILFFRNRWQQAWLIMALTMVVDLSTRCILIPQFFFTF